MLQEGHMPLVPDTICDIRTATRRTHGSVKAPAGRLHSLPGRDVISASTVDTVTVTSGGDRAGVVLREASHEDTPLGNEIKAAIKAKVTVPDNLTVQARALRARCR